MAVTDGELVRRSRAGDPQAFGELVDRYRDMAYGLGYHLTGEFEAARDLAQEAFVQAYVKLGQLREPQKFARWLRRIVVNLHQRQRRRREVTTVALGQEAEPVGQDPQPSEIEVVVRDALGKLREPERLALTLHYIDGYSHAEIGEFLGVRPQTVKTRLARARQHLRTEVMTMVEDAFEKKKLPDDFTEETVKRVLAAVSARNWQAALDEVQRSGLSPAHYPDLAYGAGLAQTVLGWEPFDPGALSDGADLLLRALESGRGDPTTVWRAVGALNALGQYSRIPPALGRYMEETQDPNERVTAGARLAATWEVLGNHAAAVEAHRASLTGLGDRADFAAKLDSYLDNPTALAYAHHGEGPEWLAITLEFWNSAREDVKTLDRAGRLLSSAITVARESEEQAEQTREWTLQYAEELLRDPRLEDREDRLVGLRTKGGIYVDMLRLYSLLGLPEKAQEAVDRAKQVADELICGAEEPGIDGDAWREAAFVTVANAGILSRCLGSKQEAQGLLRRAEQLAAPTSPCGPVRFHLAAAILETGGDRQEALDYLRRVAQEKAWAYSGFPKAEFLRDPAFELVRDDPEFLAVVDSWREAARQDQK